MKYRAATNTGLRRENLAPILRIPSRIVTTGMPRTATSSRAIFSAMRVCHCDLASWLTITMPWHTMEFKDEFCRQTRTLFPALDRRLSACAAKFSLHAFG